MCCKPVVAIFCLMAVVSFSVRGEEYKSPANAKTPVLIEKKSNYDLFVHLEKVIYRDISATSTTNAAAVQTAFKKLKDIEKIIHKEVALESSSPTTPPRRSLGRTSAVNATGTSSTTRIKNLQAKYSSEIFMLAENYRRALEMMEEVKFSDDSINLKVRNMLQGYHVFYQKLLKPEVVNKIPELVSYLRRAKEAEAEAREWIVQSY